MAAGEQMVLVRMKERAATARPASARASLATSVLSLPTCLLCCDLIRFVGGTMQQCAGVIQLTSIANQIARHMCCHRCQLQQTTPQVTVYLVATVDGGLA
jgi:hypothetical protein